MNIDKKLSQEGEHETASTIDLFKSKNTGELTYKTEYGKPVTMADKDYVNDTVNTAIAAAVSEPLSSIHFGVDPKTIGPKIVFTKSDYGTERDILVPGELEITRGDSAGIFNYITEGGFQEGSPAATYWNSEFTDSTLYGWAKIGNTEKRSYDNWENSLAGQVGVNIIGRELVMVFSGSERDYWFMIKFTQWTEGGNGGGFSYERYEFNIPIEFVRRSNSPEVVDIVSEGLIIKRNNTRGLFNAVLETEYDRNHYTSPKGTRWSSVYTDPANENNADYSNVRERIYGTWYTAINRNPPANTGIPLIMHDLSTDLYWLIVVKSWGIGDNGDLGSVNYTRRLIPLAEGIKFANGTYMTELPAAGGEVVIDGNKNVIIADSSDYYIGVTGEGFTQHIENFSGMLIVNDHYDGRVETWIAGGGTTVLLGATNVDILNPCNSTLEIEGNGYKWINIDNLKGPLTFTIIKTRANS